MSPGRPRLKERKKAMAKKYLSMDEILGAQDTEYRDVEVPGWGGTVRIGSLDAGTMIRFTEENEDPKLKKTASLRLIVASLVDGDGNRIGTETGVEAMKKKDMRSVNMLAEQILELNGFGKKEKDGKKVSSETGTDASLSV
jgi:hypothetical protein